MALSLTVISPVPTGTSAVGAGASGVSPPRAAAFDEKLRWQFAQAVDVTRDAASPAATAPVDPANRPDPTDPQDRARRALELDGPPRAGDMILDGLQRLRSTFDARQQRVGEIMQSTVLDANTLMSLQVELVNYTLLIDITSKLTGKSTQAFDTLMKGQ